MPDTNTPEIELPPLPDWTWDIGELSPSSVRAAMQDYARAAILADRERHSQPVARVGVGPFALTKPWFEMIEGKTLPDGVHDLYTRPASGDAVRQAAQAVIDAFDMAPGPRKVLRTNRCLIDLRLALLSLDAPKDAAVGAWRPIEEAPTDGTRILLGVFPTRGMASGQTEIDYYHLATWDGEHSHPYVPNNWTHFQYLPPPPGSGEGEGT